MEAQLLLPAEQHDELQAASQQAAEGATASQAQQVQQTANIWAWPHSQGQGQQGQQQQWQEGPQWGQQGWGQQGQQGWDQQGLQGQVQQQGQQQQQWGQAAFHPQPVWEPAQVSHH